jgi:hypothetical protein
MRHPRELVFVATLTAALAAHANAPPDQYRTFPPNDPTIIDRQTGLTWQRTPSGAIPPTSAANVCATVTLPGTWRLPTVKELLTIVDEAPHKEHDDGGVERDRYVDPNAFFATPAGKFIAASSDPASNVWFVDFGTGQAGFEPSGTNNYYVRCVQ